MHKVITLFCFLALLHPLCAQTASADKAGLLMQSCSFAPQADMMVLRDEGEWSVNNDLSLHLERHLVLKFFKEKKMDAAISDLVFYPSPELADYKNLSISLVEIDATTKAPIERDMTHRVTSPHLEHSTIKARAGCLIRVSYAIDFSYRDQMPDWRFQSQIPTEFSSVRLLVPELFTLREKVVGSYRPEVQQKTEDKRLLKLENQSRSLTVSDRYYQFNQVPAMEPEPFSDRSPRQLAHLHIQVIAVTREGREERGFVTAQEDGIVEQLSVRPDFIPRLGPSLEIRMDYDRRIRSLKDPMEKLSRIYDLVRRHIRWSGIDSLSAHYPLQKVWDTKKGNSTEINLALIKLLRTYGYDVQPLIVGTRHHGSIDADGMSLGDFDRTVAYVRVNGHPIVLDATGQYYDYPLLPADILNMRGLLISMDSGRVVELTDTQHRYRNQVILLGHLHTDTGYITNVYVNSTGYAKAEHMVIMDRDSMRGLRRYFEHGHGILRLRHFIVANEYVDTLPLAQEFDVRIPVTKNDNLCGAPVAWFSVPDTLFTITEDRQSPVNFGYRQKYDFVSEFTFPGNYDLYLLPENTILSTLNGNVRFMREYHSTSTNFSLKQSLTIDQTLFTLSESIELAKFLKKIAYLNAQQVILKRNN